MSSILKQRTAQGLLWGGLSGGLVQLLGALFGLWLVRLLDPSDYGRIAALVIFSNLASVLQESGFTAALANKQEPTHEEYNAVFWFNILVGCSLYIILFFCAPLIGQFYHDPILVPLARLSFLGFVISSLGTAQRAYLFGHLMVRQSSIMQLSAVAFSGIVGVALAYAGFAYWGLALQSLVYISTTTAMAWYFSPWRPTFPAKQGPMANDELRMTNYELRARPWSLDTSRMTNDELRMANDELLMTNKGNPSGSSDSKSYSSFVIRHLSFLHPAWQMFGFSSRLLVNSLALQLNNNAFGVLLSRFYPGGHVAGIYSNARKWNDMAITTISGMIQGVAQPVLRESSSGSNSDLTTEASLIRAFRKLLRFTCFVSFPCMLGLALIAEDFIVLLAGEKWHASALLLTLLCVYGAFAPLVTLYSNLIISRGRSTINMTIGLTNCALVWLGIIVLHALGYGLTAMVIFYVALNLGILVVWQLCARRLVGLRCRDALLDVAPFLVFAAAVMLFVSWLTAPLGICWTRMALRIALAATLYLGLLWAARAHILRESIEYLRRRETKTEQQAHPQNARTSPTADPPPTPPVREGRPPACHGNRA